MRESKYKPGYTHTNDKGQLTYLARVDDKVHRATFLCFCGKEFTSSVNHVISNKTRSCGCIKRFSEADSPEIYTLKSIYFNIKSRCFNIKNDAYQNYGGRGITMNLDWATDVNLFVNDIVKILGYPLKGHQLDRIDNDKGYYIDNLKWSTPKQNNNNKSTNRLISINGETKTIQEWCDLSGVSRDAMNHRLDRGWSESKLLNPVNKYNGTTSLKEIYKGMIKRCCDEKSDAYDNYGGRGISVQKSWIDNYEKFEEDIIISIGNRPDKFHTLDRIYNNGNYEVTNVRWATHTINNNNKRNNIIVTINDVSKTIREWSDSSGISYEIILERLSRNISGEKLLLPKKGKKFSNNNDIITIKKLYNEGESFESIAKKYSCSTSTIKHIVKSLGAYKENIK